MSHTLVWYVLPAYLIFLANTNKELYYAYHIILLCSWPHSCVSQCLAVLVRYNYQRDTSRLCLSKCSDSSSVHVTL